MVLQKDREKAVHIIEQGLDNQFPSDSAKNSWFLKLLYSEDSDERILLRKRKSSLVELSTWINLEEDNVPNEQMIKLIVDTLGVDVIKIKEIRLLLLERIRIQDPERFNQISKLICSTNGIFEDTSIEDIASIEISVGSKIAKEFCRAVELPMSYSRRGDKDERATHEVVKSSKYLEELMDFQKYVKSSLFNDCLFDSGGRALVVMPTGSGKTRTMIETVLDWAFINQQWPPNIVWIADREELCEQAFQSFKEVFVNLTQKKRHEMEENGMIVPSELNMYRYWGNRDIGLSFEYSELGSLPGVVITSVQQLQQRKDSDEAYSSIISNSDFFIVDEAHRNIHWLDSFNLEIKKTNPSSCMMGLTATPKRKIRFENTLFWKIFPKHIAPMKDAEIAGDIDVEKMIEILTDKKILAKRKDIDIFDIIDYDLIPPGNISAEYLAKTIQLIENVIEMGCKSILVFTRVVEDARVISSYLRMKQGPINAEYIESSTHSEIRRKIIQDFRNKEIRVLLNYGILTTGFDAPKTDAVLICRPSLEPEDSLFLQMVGRGLRGSAFGGTDSCVIAHLDDYE